MDIAEHLLGEVHAVVDIAEHLLGEVHAVVDIAEHLLGEAHAVADIAEHLLREVPAAVDTAEHLRTRFLLKLIKLSICSARSLSAAEGNLLDVVPAAATRAA